MATFSTVKSKLYLILFAHIIAFTANMLFLFLFLTRGLKIIYGNHHSGRLSQLLPFLIVGLIGYITTWLKPKWGAFILIAAGTALFLYYFTTFHFRYTLWMFAFPFFLSGLFLLAGYNAVSQDHHK